MNKENGTLNPGPKNLLDDLPDTFTRQQVAELRQSRGMSANPKDMIHAWLRRNLIEKSSTEHYYAKTANYLNRQSAA